MLVYLAYAIVILLEMFHIDFGFSNQKLTFYTKKVTYKMIKIHRQSSKN